MKHILLSLVALLTLSVPAMAFDSAAELMRSCNAAGDKSTCAEFMLETSRLLNWPGAVYGLDMGDSTEWLACPPGEDVQANNHWRQYMPLFVMDYWKNHGDPQILTSTSARDAVLIALLELWPLCASTGT